jgi:hypothetical protein
MISNKHSKNNIIIISNNNHNKNKSNKKNKQQEQQNFYFGYSLMPELPGPIQKSLVQEGAQCGVHFITMP